MWRLSHGLNSEVKRLAKPFCQEAAYPLRMGDIYSIRRRNFDRILVMPRVARLKREQDRAAFFGLSASMWSQIKRPRYKIGDDLAAKLTAAVGLNPGWMDSEREVNVKAGEDKAGHGSQNEKLDEVILASAELWVRFEEGAGRVFQPMRRLQRKLELAGMIEADGGALSPVHAEQLIDAARRGDWDGTDGADS